MSLESDRLFLYYLLVVPSPLSLFREVHPFFFPPPLFCSLFFSDRYLVSTSQRVLRTGGERRWLKAAFRNPYVLDNRAISLFVSPPPPLFFFGEKPPFHSSFSSGGGISLQEAESFPWKTTTFLSFFHALGRAGSTYFFYPPIF